jgi:hypothetical protein
VEMNEPTKRLRYESTEITTTSPSIKLNSSMSSPSLATATAQPNEVISHILSYLIHMMADNNSPRYVNKQWFTSSNNIHNITVGWNDLHQTKYSSFDLALKQYPRITSFIGFPIDDTASLLDDPNFSSTLLLLRNISLKFKAIEGSSPIYRRIVDQWVVGAQSS